MKNKEITAKMFQYRLNLLMNSQKIQGKELAQALSVSEVTISDWRTKVGGVLPRKVNRDKLTAYFDVPPEVFNEKEAVIELFHESEVMTAGQRKNLNYKFEKVQEFWYIFLFLSKNLSVYDNLFYSKEDGYVNPKANLETVFSEEDEKLYDRAEDIMKKVSQFVDQYIQMQKDKE